MRILITSPSLDLAKNVSGISSVVNTIICNNKNNTYLHYVLGSADQDKSQNKLKWITRMVKTIRGYRAFLKKNDPELVHMNIPCNTKGILREYIVFTINKRHKKKIVAHLHGGKYLMAKPSNKIIGNFFKRILSESDRVIVLSEIEKKSLSGIYGYNNAVVLYNSVNTSADHKVFDKSPEDILQVLFLGRIHESKGIEDIVEAFKKLFPEKRFRFVVCGTGPLENYLIEQCSGFMGKDFEYRGIVSGDIKANTILGSDIFILPSRYGEGLPVSLLEAMSAGVVPVVTNDASMKFVIKDGVNGIFVGKNNSGDIYTKLETLMNDPALMKKLSMNARKTIEEQFDVRIMINNLENIYEEAMKPS